jgi:hypothetical protein
MKKLLLTFAFFSVIFAAAPCWINSAYAQSIASAAANNAAAVIAQAIAPTQIQATPQAHITLVSPKGGEVYVNGNRYPISWNAQVPEVPDAYKQRGYKLTGEILLLDENSNQAALQKNMRIAFLNEQELAKGSLTFLAGAQTDLAYGHTQAPNGKYKIRMNIRGAYDCGPNAKCRPFFETTTLSNTISFKYN